MIVPDPSTFTVETLKRMSGTSWSLLAMAVAGWTPVPNLEHVPLDDLQRRRAADIVQKAVELQHAEVQDHFRATLLQGSRDPSFRRVIPNTVPEFIEFSRELLSRAEELLAFDTSDPVVQSKFSELDGGDGIIQRAEAHMEMMKQNPELARASVDCNRMMLRAWDVLQLYRADPTRRYGPEDLPDPDASP